MNHLSGHDNVFRSGLPPIGPNSTLSGRVPSAALVRARQTARPLRYLAGPHGSHTGRGRLGRDQEFGPILLRKIENPL
jgi:hypothetical protein